MLSNRPDTNAANLETALVGATKGSPPANINQSIKFICKAHGSMTTN